MPETKKVTVGVSHAGAPAETLHRPLHNKQLTGRQTVWLKSILIALSIAVATPPSMADPAAEQKASINKISEQIKTLSKTLNSSKKKQRSARDDLLLAERRLAKSRVRIASLSKQIIEKQNEAKRLREQLEQAEKSQGESRAALRELLTSRYKNGQTNYLKLLLNQENPYAVGRLANYSEYFSLAIRQRLSQLQQEIAEISRLEKQRTAALADLNKIQASQQQQQQELLESTKQRQTIVSRIDAEVEQSSKQLSRLKQDRARLTALIKQIAKQAELLRKAEQKRRQEEAAIAARNNRAPPKRTPVAGGFLKQKQRLSYPSEGKKIRRFGSRIAASGMTSDGVFFATKNSAPVKAIYQGRVLFADFLKGYGLLLIVDHGDDHISLYGHNEVLLKSVGDTVATNEIVSRSGMSGGLKTPGLYFEIRHNATPVNPANWCQ